MVADSLPDFFGNIVSEDMLFDNQKVLFNDMKKFLENFILKKYDHS